MKKRFVIADPTMNKLRGHNREINLVCAREYVARGYQVDIYVKKSYPVVPADQGLDGIRVIPHFSSSPYQFIKAQQLLLGVDGYRNAMAQSFAKELSGIGEQCPLLLSSAYPSLVSGAAIAKWKFPVHALIHREPDFLSHEPGAHWRLAFQMAQAAHVLLGIHVLEPVLQGLYAKCAEGRFRIQLAPNPLRPATKTSVVRRNKCIGLLGGLRSEQGLQFFPAAVKSLLASGFNVLVQDPDNKIQDPPHPSIKVIGFVEDFRGAIQSCSALLLNYDPAAYATSTSGIAWEALVTGTPVLYSRGTASANTFQHYNCGIAFDYGSISQIAAAAESLQRSYTEHLNLAEAAALQVQKLHNVGRFVDHLENTGLAS